MSRTLFGGRRVDAGSAALGPMTGRTCGHLGLINILGRADPRREISAGLLVTGKAILGGHLFALVRALSAIARECR